MLASVFNSIATHARELLDQLCDVSGVLGALLVSEDGVLLAQALPPEYATRAADAARRLPLLLDALAAGRDVQSYTLRFAEHRLYLRGVEGAFLGVLTELSCDAVLLKMTMNIAGKRLTCLAPH
jgi:predicted regulator of Ras-like GTPase activity (Roadblock/LC7/MglB family)